MTDGSEVRLGRDGTRIGWAYAVVTGLAAVVAIVVGIVTGAPGAVGYLVLMLLGTSASLVVLLTRLGDGHVVLGEEDVEVRVGRTVKAWAWSDVLEIGVAPAGYVLPFVVPGCTVVVRPDGGRWDTPGPNQPFSTTLPVFGLGAQRRVREALRRACAEHDVPFDENGLRMAEQPRPDSWLRTDRQPDRKPDREPDPTTKGPGA